MNTHTDDGCPQTAPADVQLSDAFYRFLQNVFHTAPEDRFHHLITQACQLHQDEESVYRYIQNELKTIKPLLADLTYSLPALLKQKAQMVAQTLKVLGDRRQFNGYLEIGSKGRYFRSLAAALELSGPTYFVDERPQSYSPVNLMERGQLAQLHTHHPLADYAPLPEDIAPASLELVTCYTIYDAPKPVTAVVLDRMPASNRSGSEIKVLNGSGEAL